jgi:hypothetical protein
MNGKDPAVLRAEMAITRAEMDETIEALHGRLNPSVLKEQIVESFREAKQTITTDLKHEFADAKVAIKEEMREAKARLREELTGAKTAVREATIGKVEHMMHQTKDKVVETGHTVFDEMKANPIPVALIGAGVAWWFVSTRMRASDGWRPRRDLLQQPEAGEQGGSLEGVAERAAHSVEDAAHAVGDKVHEVGDKVSAAAHRVSDSATSAAHTVGETVKDAATQVSSVAKRAVNATRDQAVALEKRVISSYEANPIAVGAAALALGAAFGLAIPHTRREDELLGGARDDLVGKAGGLAHEALETIEDKTSELLDKAVPPSQAPQGGTMPNGPSRG